MQAASSDPIVAIVDDDVAIREALADMMQTCGYRCISYESASSFLKSDTASVADCILLDVNMPGITGLELQAKLNEQGSMIPLIFISSHDDEQTRSTAMAAGAFGFLGKPFEFERLAELINSALA